MRKNGQQSMLIVQTANKTYCGHLLLRCVFDVYVRCSADSQQEKSLHTKNPSSQAGVVFE